MSWDIYGNPLQRGHCEVHPHVAEEYPCSVCLYEREQHKDATRQCPDCNESVHYLGQAQEHIKELERQRNDLLAALEAFREVGGTEVGGRGMSKYKMVPVEPTIDMVIAGEDAWDTQLDKRLFAKDNGEAFATYPSEETHELCSRVAYRAMLAAAPDAVQVGPVAWLPYLSDRADGVAGHYAIARKNPAGYREVWNLRNHHWAAFSDEVLTLDEALAILKKLEMPTAPKPSSQLPDFATDPDDSDEGASLWDHGFKQGWNACLEGATKAMQPVEQPVSWIRISGDRVILSRCDWMYPASTVDSAGPRDEQRFTAVGRRDGDIVLLAPEGSLDREDMETMLAWPSASKSVEQQSDVTQLVEALEAVMEFGCDPKSNRGMWALEKAKSALAAYHKGDES